jgi:guanylate kinase
MLVILSGSSGVGKNTIINTMLERHADAFELLPTFTTRAMREDESEGRPYFFVSEEGFQAMLERGELLEHQRVHGHYYGVSRRVLEERIRSGKILLKDIDVLGTINLLNEIEDAVRLLTFFYCVRSKDVLVERLRGRGEKDIDLRMERYHMELAFSARYDYIIENNERESTVALTKAAIDFEQRGGALLPAGAAGIDRGRVEALAGVLDKGEFLPAIDVAMEGGRMYIIDGRHRYLAALLSGRRLAKRIVSPERIPRVPRAGGEIAAWEAALEAARRGSDESGE